jgi:hypothetical protein
MKIARAASATEQKRVGMAATAPGYTIDTDTSRGILHIRFYGFWDDATLERYIADLRRFAPAPGSPQASGSEVATRVLIDLREHLPLSKERAARMQREVDLANNSARVAIVLASSGILKMQVERVAGQRTHRFFLSEEEALEWLLTE